MATERPTVTLASVAVASATLSYPVRRRIFLYLGVLIVLLAFVLPAEA